MTGGVGAVLMGIVWMGSIALYGVRITHLGSSGAAIGWGLFFTFVTLAANLSGLIAGEWRGVGSRPLRNLGQRLVVARRGINRHRLGQSLVVEALPEFLL